jgi:hypothetical protein
VLGIDNVVFVSLLAANLDAKSGRTARQIGFALALFSVSPCIGTVQDIKVMIAAVAISMAVMYGASGTVAGFIGRHPTTKSIVILDLNWHGSHCRRLRCSHLARIRLLRKEAWEGSYIAGCDGALRWCARHWVPIFPAADAPSVRDGPQQPAC